MKPASLVVAALVAVVLFISASPASADDPIESAMDRDPELPAPRLVATFHPRLLDLWLRALDRPEAEYRTQAALAIAVARERGMASLELAIPALTRELARPDQHPSVALAAARALVALDAKDAAAALFKLSSAGDNDLREVIEPALARWNYGPAKEDWLERLDSPPPHRRGVVLAAQCLAAVGEARAVPKLRDIVLSPDTAPGVRLEVARALGVLRTSGGEADADRLAADATPKGVIGRIAAALTLRRHGGPEVVRRLQAFAGDPEPSIAAVAVARLLELDPAHVEPVLPAVLGSEDANVRKLGVETLSRRPSEEHVRLLADRLSDPHPDVRSRARAVLREQAREAKLRPAILRDAGAVLGGSDWRGKEQAAVLLAHLDHKPAAGRLVGLLKDSRGEVGIAAAWALRVLAVPDTLAPSLDHFRQATRKGQIPPDWADAQLTHLAQLFGITRYAPADAALRPLVPPGAPAGSETRAAACWALGLLHEGKAVPELSRLFAGRVSAVMPADVEDPRVRRMSAVAIGRMRAKDAVPTLRKFYVGAPSLDLVSNACGWAIEQIAGEKVPPPGTVEVGQLAWFLVPVG